MATDHQKTFLRESHVSSAIVSLLSTTKKEKYYFFISFSLLLPAYRGLRFPEFYSVSPVYLKTPLRSLKHCPILQNMYTEVHMQQPQIF